MKRFGLIGAGGYIAPRHMKAIMETGGELTAAMDVNDSVGIMDSHFPEAQFFTKFEQFEGFVEDERRAGRALDYVAIATPNFLHNAHMRFALRNGADAICEKPLVLDESEIDDLLAIEKETDQEVNTILQLRLHPSIIGLRDQVAAGSKDNKHEVDLSYVTSRGNWYLKSWKGFTDQSGGIATNIGVHFYDMLHFVFGTLQQNVVHYTSPTKAAGYLEYENARVRWFLSIDVNDVPQERRDAGQRTYRSITCDGEEIEFSGGFTDLHTRSYEEILKGNGFGLEENRVAISTVANIRNGAINLKGGEQHPFLKALL